MAAVTLTLNEAFDRALRAFHAGGLMEAEKLCQAILAAREDHVDALRLLGGVQSRLGRTEAALASFERALALRPDDAGTHGNRGWVLAALGRHQTALASYERALALEPDDADVLSRRGNTLCALNRPEEALASYERALAIRPDHAEALNNRGSALRQLGRLDEALASYDRALAVRPDYAQAHCNRGVALQELGRLDAALASHERALAIKPDLGEALSGRGNALLALDRLAEALASYERALAVRPDHAEAHYNRGVALGLLRRPEDALASYDRALALEPDYADALYNRASALRAMNRWQEAVAGYRRVSAIRADHAEARLAACVAELPILYADEAEIASRRAAYAKALGALREEIERGTTRLDLADAGGAHQPFYLAYQGCNDRDLQAAYGSLLRRVVAARYPPAALPPPPGPDEPVRVGIVSAFFCAHSVWKLPVKGWMSQLDRTQFRLLGYHTRSHQDGETGTAAALCDRFVQGPLSIDRWRQTILSDAPHVLLYPEIGMDAHSTALAAQRLAPAQCISWGHPETSGFPTLDYFLSSDLMEPPDGQEHYTERLVRLPNLSVYYEPLGTEPVALGRADLGLRPASTVFWCGQSLFKYLPQFDQVFARIARQAGDCQFAFIEHPTTQVTALFKQRLDRAFAAAGLRAEDYCVVLPGFDPHSFVAAIGLCDIVLDSIGWSGCNSTLEGLAHDLPIVTMPGRFMRGRHTMAILRMMDVGETIAESVDDYVSAAVRLARDLAWRSAVKARISAGKHRVYRDRTPIPALQEFLCRVARPGHGGDVR